MRLVRKMTEQKGAVSMHQVERGAGRTLLLIHGLGGSWQSWSPILVALSAEGRVVAIDLPGHGASPAEPGSDTFAGLVDAVERYIDANVLAGVDMVGSSMGARIVIGWGRQDRLCFPRQAERAKAAFPPAELHWFNDCGHFPMWDQPEEAAALILARTG